MQIVYTDYVSSFDKLLTKDGTCTIHQRNLKVLALEMYKIAYEKLPNFMKDLVEKIDRNYHTRSSYEVELDKNGNVKKCSKKSNYRLQNVNTVTFGHQSFRYLSPKIWGFIPNEWIDSTLIQSKLLKTN